jgi:hypothetical protein
LYCSLSQFDCVAVGIAHEELWIAGAAASVIDINPHLAQLPLSLSKITHIESNVTIVARGISVTRHQLNTHQMQLVTVAQVVPPSLEAEFGAGQWAQAEHIFVKIGRSCDIGDEKSRVMES